MFKWNFPEHSECICSRRIREHSNASDAGYCFIDGMDAQQEILLNLLIPALLLGITGGMLCTKPCNIAWLRMVALVTLLVILVVWLALNVRLCRQSDANRQNDDLSDLCSVVKAYKPQHWWWESVLLSRRMAVALLTIVLDTEYAHALLNSLLCLYLAAHISTGPFKYGRINRLETVCILMLIVVKAFVNAAAFSLDRRASDPLIAAMSMLLLLCIVLPMLMVCYEKQTEGSQDQAAGKGLPCAINMLDR